jgi:hypothetical protein
MTPLFACFPVCLTFVALAVLGLLVMVAGLYSSGANASDPAAAMRSSVDDADTGPPRWWVIVAIFVVVFVAGVLLALISPDMDGLRPR